MSWCGRCEAAAPNFLLDQRREKAVSSSTCERTRVLLVCWFVERASALPRSHRPAASGSEVGASHRPLRTSHSAHRAPQATAASQDVGSACAVTTCRAPAADPACHRQVHADRPQRSQSAMLCASTIQLAVTAGVRVFDRGCSPQPAAARATMHHGQCERKQRWPFTCAATTSDAAW